MSQRLRTEKTALAYQKWGSDNLSFEGCVLCQKPTIKDFTHWRLVPNDFPYDKIADKHDLLITKAHKTEAGLTSEEREELIHLKQTELNDTYEYILEPLLSLKSIPDHFHLHLTTIKPNV